MNPFWNRPDEWALFDPLVGETMLELGNKKNGPLTYKAYFESLGIKHTSIDWNGQDGALKRDLRKPLWPELGQFATVSNIGTTEHVSDQRAVWENIHHLTAVGGTYVGLTPYHDGRSWWWHAEWLPTEAFFESYAALNGWHIDRLYSSGRPEPFRNLYVRMVRAEDRPFTMPDLSLIKRNVMRPRHPAPAGCVEPTP